MRFEGEVFRIWTDRRNVRISGEKIYIEADWRGFLEIAGTGQPPLSYAGISSGSGKGGCFHAGGRGEVSQGAVWSDAQDIPYGSVTHPFTPGAPWRAKQSWRVLDVSAFKARRPCLEWNAVKGNTAFFSKKLTSLIVYDILTRNARLRAMCGFPLLWGGKDKEPWGRWQRQG